MRIWAPALTMRIPRSSTGVRRIVIMVVSPHGAAQALRRRIGRFRARVPVPAVGWATRRITALALVAIVVARDVEDTGTSPTNAIFGAIYGP